MSDAVDLEYDGEEDGLWELADFPGIPHRKTDRPDHAGWWCFLLFHGTSADTALQVVHRPEGLTILQYSEDPMLVVDLDRNPDQWIGPFLRVRNKNQNAQ